MRIAGEIRMTAEQMDTERQSGQRVINLVSKPIDQEVPRSAGL